MSYHVDIKKAEMLNHNVKRFVTTKPDGYSFTPGQATKLSLCRDGYRSKERPFTFTSTPDEDELEFTIKLYYEKDGVTDEMSSVEAGEQFEIGDPWGAIEYKGPGVFIAGGAGITPFISIFRDLNHSGELSGNSLWFSNSTPKDLFLEGELRELFPEDQLHLLVTDAEDTAYEEGRIDAGYLTNKKELLNSGYVYLCGPPQMTEEMIDHLAELGIDEEKIVHEDFS